MCITQEDDDGNAASGRVTPSAPKVESKPKQNNNTF
jgi:hypothetical protein